jgi:hypothetical protein
MTNFSQDSWWPGQDLDQACPKCDSRSVTFMLTFSIIKLFLWAKHWLIFHTSNFIYITSSLTLPHTNWYWSSAYCLYTGAQVLQCTDNLRAGWLVHAATSTLIPWHKNSYAVNHGVCGIKRAAYLCLVLRSTCSLPVLSLDWLQCLLLLWLYSPCGPWPLSQFLNLYTVGRTPCTSDWPIARLLPTHRAAQTE